MDGQETPRAMADVWAGRLLVASVVALIIIVLYFAARRLILGADRFTIENTKPIVSTIDGIPYRVHEAHLGPQKAADTLAKLNGRVIDVLRHLRNRYLRGPPMPGTEERVAATKRLLARYNPDNLAENSPQDPTGDTAYSLDKGAIVAICLRDRGTPRNGAAPNAIHDLSTLTFVTLHEMSHIAIDEIDHPKKFWETFKWLLEEAEQAGIYTSPDYSLGSARYCGMDVNYNPRYDGNTEAIM